jgi:hypothetical protein
VIAGRRLEGLRGRIRVTADRIVCVGLEPGGGGYVGRGCSFSEDEYLVDGAAVNLEARRLPSRAGGGR